MTVKDVISMGVMLSFLFSWAEGEEAERLFARLRVIAELGNLGIAASGFIVPSLCLHIYDFLSFCLHGLISLLARGCKSASLCSSVWRQIFPGEPTYHLGSLWDPPWNLGDPSGIPLEILVTWFKSHNSMVSGIPKSSPTFIYLWST